MLEIHAAVLQKSPERRAARYTLKNWAALTRYCEDGDLEIDNNVCVANSKSRGNRCLGTARDSFAKNACGPKTPCFQSIATGFGGPGEPKCGARNVVLHG